MLLPLNAKAGAFPGKPHAFCVIMHSLLSVDFYTTQYANISIHNIDTRIHTSNVYIHTHMA